MQFYQNFGNDQHLNSEFAYTFLKSIKHLTVKSPGCYFSGQMLGLCALGKMTVQANKNNRLWCSTTWLSPQCGALLGKKSKHTHYFPGVLVGAWLQMTGAL